MRFRSSIARIISAIGSKFHEPRKQLFFNLELQAMQDSARYIEAHSDHLTNYYRDHWKMREAVFRQKPGEGLLLEFGVNRGRSANFFADILKKNGDNRSYYGFDTFTGLTEDWGGTDRASGTFDNQGNPPPVRDNVRLVQGDILDTLGPFLESSDGNIAFMHIDTDTYTPASHILKQTKNRLVNGTVILFDELLGYPNYKSHELKVLEEELPEGTYRFIAFGVAHENASLIKAAIEITDTPNK